MAKFKKRWNGARSCSGFVRQAKSHAGLHPLVPSAKTEAMKDGPPRYFEDYEIGQRFPLGSTSFTEEEIVSFGTAYDPQPFHVDSAAARNSLYGGVITSGWHIAAKLMRLFVDNYIDPRTALGSPGVDEVRWLKPVRPGDTLTAYVECAGKTPSRSKPTLGVINEHWHVTNQNDELVMTLKGINMVRRRPQ